MYIHKMIVISSCYYSRISLKYCVWVICAENSKFQTVVNIGGHFLEAAEVPCSLRHLVQLEQSAFDSIVATLRLRSPPTLLRRTGSSDRLFSIHLAISLISSCRSFPNGVADIDEKDLENPQLYAEYTQ